MLRCSAAVYAARSPSDQARCDNEGSHDTQCRYNSPGLRNPSSHLPKNTQKTRQNPTRGRTDHFSNIFCHCDLDFQSWPKRSQGEQTCQISIGHGSSSSTVIVQHTLLTTCSIWTTKAVVISKKVWVSTDVVNTRSRPNGT